MFITEITSAEFGNFPHTSLNRFKSPADDPGSERTSNITLDRNSQFRFECEIARQS